MSNPAVHRKSSELRLSDSADNIKQKIDYTPESINKTYQHRVTSIMYSMFNPYVSFPEPRVDPEDDISDDDDDVSEVEDYESPVTTLRLKILSKDDDKIRDELIEKINEDNQSNSEKLSNEEATSGISFSTVDLALPQLSISRKLQQKEKERNEKNEEILKKLDEERKNAPKVNREKNKMKKQLEIYQQKEEIRDLRRRKEEQMSKSEKNRLEAVRKEIDEQSKAASIAPSTRYAKTDYDKSTVTYQYEETQKKQKEEFLKTRGSTKKKDNIAAILMGNYRK